MLASRPNKYVFNFRQKVSTVTSVRRTSAGKLFQSRYPAAANRNSHMGFRLVLTSVTLSDLERRNSLYCVISPNSIVLQADYVTVVEDRPIISAKYRLSVMFGHNWPTQQSHGLFVTTKHLVVPTLAITSKHSASPFVSVLNAWNYLMTLITITYYQVPMTSMAGSRSWGQRSRPGSGSHGNIVHPMAPRPLKGFKPKPTQILAIVGTRTDYVFKFTESRSRSQKLLFVGGGIRIDGLPSKTILLFNRGVEMMGLFSIIDIPPGDPLSNMPPVAII